MSARTLLPALSIALACTVSTVSAQPPRAFDTIQKAQMQWNLAYNFETGQVSKYEIDTVSRQRDSNFRVGEAGSEFEQIVHFFSRVYITQRVVKVDEQKVTTLEFTYDNVVQKERLEGQEEQVLDTSALIGRKFIARISSKGAVVDIEGSGDTAEFQEFLENLFINYPDQTMKLTDTWDDQKESESTDPNSGLQIAQQIGTQFRIRDFEEDLRRKRDILVLDVKKTIDQQLSVTSEDPGGTVVQTSGRGSGEGKVTGTIRVDPRSGQLVHSEMKFRLDNNLTVDEHQLVGPTLRTKFGTEFTSTTSCVLKLE